MEFVDDETTGTGDYAGPVHRFIRPPRADVTGRIQCECPSEGVRRRATHNRAGKRTALSQAVQGDIIIKRGRHRSNAIHLNLRARSDNDRCVRQRVYVSCRVRQVERAFVDVHGSADRVQSAERQITLASLREAESAVRQDLAVNQGAARIHIEFERTGSRERDWRVKCRRICQLQLASLNESRSRVSGRTGSCDPVSVKCEGARTLLRDLKHTIQIADASEKARVRWVVHNQRSKRASRAVFMVLDEVIALIRVRECRDRLCKSVELELRANILALPEIKRHARNHLLIREQGQIRAVAVISDLHTGALNRNAGRISKLKRATLNNGVTSVSVGARQFQDTTATRGCICRYECSISLCFCEAETSSGNDATNREHIACGDTNCRIRAERNRSCDSRRKPTATLKSTSVSRTGLACGDRDRLTATIERERLGDTNVRYIEIATSVDRRASRRRAKTVCIADGELARVDRDRACVCWARTTEGHRSKTILDDVTVADHPAKNRVALADRGESASSAAEIDDPTEGVGSCRSTRHVHIACESKRAAADDSGVVRVVQTIIDNRQCASRKRLIEPKESTCESRRACPVISA